MAIDILHGTGYRIGTTDRVLGSPTSAADAFVVLNQTNNKLFIASGGVWTSGGTFPGALSQNDFNAWLLS